MLLAQFSDIVSLLFLEGGQCHDDGSEYCCEQSNLRWPVSFCAQAEGLFDIVFMRGQICSVPVFSMEGVMLYETVHPYS